MLASVEEGQAHLHQLQWDKQNRAYFVYYIEVYI